MEVQLDGTLNSAAELRKDQKEDGKKKMNSSSLKKLKRRQGMISRITAHGSK